jgi:hypothetical protein
MPILRLDPAWLFLIAGLAIIASTVLVGAQQSLEDVQWQRRRALALEAHRIDRIKRYDAYLAALDRHDPALVLSLVASELNEMPINRAPLQDALQQDQTPRHAVFASLEPPRLDLPDRTVNNSLLSRLATAERTRPVLLSFGALCLLVALLPAARHIPSTDDPDEADVS